MNVVWAWALLDVAEDGFDEELDFWQRVTRIPANRYASELAFWTRLTRRSPSWSEPDDSGLLPLARPDGLPLRLLTQRLDEADGVVSAHLTGRDPRTGLRA